MANPRAGPCRRGAETGAGTLQFDRPVERRIRACSRQVWRLRQPRNGEVGQAIAGVDEYEELRPDCRSIETEGNCARLARARMRRRLSQKVVVDWSVGRKAGRTTTERTCPLPAMEASRKKYLSTIQLDGSSTRSSMSNPAIRSIWRHVDQARFRPSGHTTDEDHSCGQDFREQGEAIAHATRRGRGKKPVRGRLWSDQFRSARSEPAGERSDGNSSRASAKSVRRALAVSSDQVVHL
jgi:hypothetical protein